MCYWRTNVKGKGRFGEWRKGEGEKLRGKTKIDERIKEVSEKNEKKRKKGVKEVEIKGKMEGKKKETKVTKREECVSKVEKKKGENEKQQNVLPFDRIRSFWSV